MVSKQQIIGEIQRTAEENGGRPLGTARFEKETGIKPHDWGKHWARFGDAQKEAGFIPNQLQAANTAEFMFEKLISIMRKLGKFPTYGEIEVERAFDADLPTKGTFQRLGTQHRLAVKITEYCKDQAGLADIIELCKPILEKPVTNSSSGDTSTNQVFGEVYLFKSGRYYKIGKTKDTVRRGDEIRIQLPERMDLIHSIKTDDPSGIEAYWHRRFDAKRMNGEWFDLNSTDIKAFRQWRRIF